MIMSRRRCCAPHGSISTADRYFYGETGTSVCCVLSPPILNNVLCLLEWKETLVEGLAEMNGEINFNNRATKVLEGKGGKLEDGEGRKLKFMTGYLSFGLSLKDMHFYISNFSVNNTNKINVCYLKVQNPSRINEC